MRAQVVVTGAAGRRVRLRLSEELGPSRAHRVQASRPDGAGAAIGVARALTRLGLLAGLSARIGNEAGDRGLVAALRREGILTGGIRLEDAPTPISLRLDTPTRSFTLEAGTPASIPSAEKLARTFRGARHVHVSSEMLGPPEEAGWEAALRTAKALGASTSLDAVRSDFYGTDALRRVLGAVDLFFAPAERIREIAFERRLSRASEAVRGLGTRWVVADLGAGGWRVYPEAAEAVRVPSFGEEVGGRGSFVGAFLLGWLAGAPGDVCAVLGAAAKLRAPADKRPPDRRELASRLRKARKVPRLRRLVPAMVEAERLLKTLRRLPPRLRPSGYGEASPP